MPAKGRPPCSKECCVHPAKIREMYEAGMRTEDIGRQIGVSDTHICQQLKVLKVRMRNRWFYKSEPNRGGKGRKSNPLWELSDEELFDIPAEALAERMGVQKQSVFRIRWRRRKGD